MYQLHVLLLLAIAFQATASNTIVDLALATPSLSTLVTALKAADLVKTLEGPGPFTVFAPTNDAFSALPPGVLDNLLKPENIKSLYDVLTYHVLGNEVHSNQLLDGEQLRTVETEYVTVRLAGKDILINSAIVTTANINASNGVIHIIDAVLIPSALPPTPTPAPGTQNIVELASATPSLSTLVTALTAGDLVKTLEGVGPFTVFAPTNDAFNALPAGVLANLLKPENKAQLDDLLTLHVVAGDVHAADIVDGERLKTVEGDYIMAAVNSSGVFINNARVTTADVDASNGVVHIIDAVLQDWNPSPEPNHLWFRGWRDQGFRVYQCGEVDAATRIPAALFEPSNAATLQAYVDITIALWGFDIVSGNLAVIMELGRCAENNYTVPAGQQSVDWAGYNPYPNNPNRRQLMDGICQEKCDCNFRGGNATVPELPTCKDEPDNPKAGKWCSLCGPKYNKPIEIALFQCDTRGVRKDVCPGPKPAAEKKWEHVLTDLLDKL